jgi:hypothetical protein
LDPFDLCVETVGAYASRRDHYVATSNASDGHQLPFAAVFVERFDGRIW